MKPSLFMRIFQSWAREHFLAARQQRDNVPNRASVTSKNKKNFEASVFK